MPKCSICGTSKIFLKLNNGLCTDCTTLLNECEDKYKTLLKNTVDPSFNKDKLILEILALSVDVRKFDNLHIGTISKEDCDSLLEVVKNIDPSINVSTSDDKAKITHFVENPLLKEQTKFNKIEETLSAPTAYDNTKVTVSVSNENPSLIKADTPIALTNTIVPSTIIDILTLPSTNAEASDKTLIDLSESIISDFNDEPSPEVSTAPAVDKMPSSTVSLSSTEKSEILEFLNILNDNFLSLDEKAYALFTLKEKYLDLFPINILNSLFEIDFNHLYEETLRKLSLALSCPKDKVYSHYNYVAFSIQTTGINIHSNSVIEIAGVRVSYGQAQDTFHSLVNPLQSISLATEDKTKLSNTALSEAQPLDVVLQEFVKFCNNLDLVTHNVNFNYKFLDTYSQKLFRVPLGLDNVCTVKLYRTRYKQFHGEPTKDCSLLTCCEDLLSKEDLHLIENTSSIALSSAIGTFKLYEIIKTRYK
ncbi:MAG: 3'-5' exonuclease [Clostridium sp.]|uniref:3'-5' exonuclease n=1 Tax=Clostridium sp. TaxID=1506 RepID=UPI003F39AE64